MVRPMMWGDTPGFCTPCARQQDRLDLLQRECRLRTDAGSRHMQCRCNDDHDKVMHMMIWVAASLRVTPSSSKRDAPGIHDLFAQGRLAMGAFPTHAAEQDQALLGAWQPTLKWPCVDHHKYCAGACLTWAETKGAQPGRPKASESPATWPTGSWCTAAVDELLGGDALSPGFMPCMPAASHGPATATLRALALLLPQQQRTPWVVAGLCLAWGLESLP